MRFCVSGASGFLGTPLCAHLNDQGHHVTRLVRREPSGADESRWDPARHEVDQSVIDAADVVVNLSGAAIARWPWTESYKRELVDSRVSSTTTLAAAIARVDGDKPAMISGSGMAAYGDDRGAELLDEQAGPGGGYLNEVVGQWEAATAEAEQAGARVCHVRTTVVLHRTGGALQLMSVPFKVGLGARLGSGRQYFSIISRRDWVRGVEFLATQPNASGPYNFAAPQSSTNAQFTKALAAQLHRPSVLAVPAFAIKLALGELSSELLGSMRVEPKRLLDAGFDFEDPDLESVVAEALRGAGSPGRDTASG